MTSALGWLDRTTVNSLVPPASLVASELREPTVNPAVSLSVFFTEISLILPLYWLSSEDAVAVSL